VSEPASGSMPPTSSWSISRLSHLLGETVVRNVFIVPPSQRRRFKFFKQKRNDDHTNNGKDEYQSSSATPSSASSSPSSSYPVPATGDKAGHRESMPFNRFVELSKSSTDRSESNAYYLYGEPMPQQLQTFFPIPHVLSSVPSPLTSILLWVSPAPTISPLHFDLNEGILAQIDGEKRVSMARPDEIDNLYPYPIQHVHDRQSQVDDIHDPDPHRFPRARAVKLWSGLLTPGSLLYLPYGWWHQLESVSTSISVSMRWNPYDEALRTAAITAHATRNMPAHIRSRILIPIMKQHHIADAVVKIHMRRWEQTKQQEEDGREQAIAKTQS